MSVNYNPATPTNGLVLCLDTANRRSYPGSGTTWFDLSGKGNHGTVTNADLSTFWKADGGVSANFDGSDDYVNLGTSLNSRLVQSAAITVSAWVYATNVTGDRAILNNSKYSPNYDGFNFQIVNGKLRIDLVGDVLGPLKRKETTNAVISTNTWYHVAVTKPANAVTSSISLFVDGVKPATTDAYNDSVVDAVNSVNLQIGARNGTNTPFVGQLDDIRIYNRALSPSEVYQLFSSKRGRFGV